MFQNCVSVLNSLIRGDFGKCDTYIEKFKDKCHIRFPYTAAFQLISIKSPNENNHVPPDQDNCNSN